MLPALRDDEGRPHATPSEEPRGRFLFDPHDRRFSYGESASRGFRNRPWPEQAEVSCDAPRWQDTLHEGPIPALPREELLRKRARFLADCGWGRQPALLSSLERRDQQLRDALRDDAHVVLWFEHDLYDQLQLLDVLTLAHTAEAAPELIVIGSFPGKPSFSGLGELTARELETLWPSRRPAEPAALEAAAAAWAALQAPEPTALVEWATQETTHLPFLAPALQRLLDELRPPPGSRALNGTRSKQSTPAPAHPPPPSSPHNDSRTPPSSATPRSTAASPRSGRAQTDSSKPTTGPRFLRHPRSATTSSSPAFNYGSPQPASAPYAARPTESNCSASTAGSAEPTSASRTPGDGTPPNTSSFRHLGTSRQLRQQLLLRRRSLSQSF